MRAKNTVVIKTHIDWLQAQAVVYYFLDSTYPLPLDVTDKQLLDLMAVCDNARKRLREKSDPYVPHKDCNCPQCRTRRAEKKRA